jgi:AraC-like DNA-binding protein
MTGMSSLMAYESRHTGSTTLTSHRHARAYAALVVDGSHIESGPDGPMLCEPGLLVLHPAWDVHGNRFESCGARVFNLECSHVVEAVRTVRVDSVREACALMQRASEQFSAFAESCRPVDPRLPLPDWQAAFLRKLREADDELRVIAADVGISAAHASRALKATFGMSPRQLRRELRWREAHRLLRGSLTLGRGGRVRRLCGPDHLSRWCLAQTRMTLAALRREARETPLVGEML